MTKRSVFIWLLFYGILFGLSLVPHLMFMPNQSDKMLHATAYCFLMTGPMIAFSSARARVMVGVFLFMTGVAVELLQGVVGGREVSALDVVADVAGISIGVVTGLLCRNGLMANPERAGN